MKNEEFRMKNEENTIEKARPEARKLASRASSEAFFSAGHSEF